LEAKTLTEKQTKESSKRTRREDAVLGNLDRLIETEKDEKKRKQLLRARSGFLGYLEKKEQPEDEDFWDWLKE
jgi:hypothetical protein